MVRGVGRARADALGRELGVRFVGLDTLPVVDGLGLRRPRVGIYRSHLANMDEGWVRWLLEGYGFAWRNVSDADVRARRLDDIEVLVLADEEAQEILNGHLAGTMPQEYVGGMGVEGEKLGEWTNELIASIASGDTQIHSGPEMWDPKNWPAEAQGWGFTEAPRGALGHWMNIKDTKIANYQAIVPSTWNCSPRDAKGQPGPYEAALISTPIADEKMPLEVLRTIHSFDPCMACGVHLLDINGNEINQVSVATPDQFNNPLLRDRGTR